MLQIIDKDPSYFDKRYQKEARDSINTYFVVKMN